MFGSRRLRKNRRGYAKSVLFVGITLIVALLLYYALTSVFASPTQPSTVVVANGTQFTVQGPGGGTVNFPWSLVPSCVANFPLSPPSPCGGSLSGAASWVGSVSVCVSADGPTQAKFNLPNYQCSSPTQGTSGQVLDVGALFSANNAKVNGVSTTYIYGGGNYQVSFLSSSITTVTVNSSIVLTA